MMLIRVNLCIINRLWLCAAAVAVNIFALGSFSFGCPCSGPTEDRKMHIREEGNQGIVVRNYEIRSPE